jgi:hypothetical protein
VAPAFPPAIPSLDYGDRFRIGLRAQDQTQPKKLTDLSMQIDNDIYFGGQLHRFLKWQAGVTISYSGNIGQPSTATILPLDVVARFEPLPEFNVFMGRMIVIADRFTPSGPWGMDEFLYPGVFLGGTLGAPLPKSGSTGRDLGVNVWGALAGGLIKYYLGAYEFHDPTLHPLYSGRVQLSLINGEPGFYHRTTYYGEKDFVSIGVGGQYQKDGSVGTVPAVAAMGDMPARPAGTVTDDWRYFTADLTLDKKLGDAGTFSAFGGYSKFGGDYNLWNNFWHVALGFTFPQVVGIGKFRPGIRFQQAVDTAQGADPTRTIDVQLSYLIMKWYARFNIGYRHSSISTGATTPVTSTPRTAMGTVAGNMLWLGLVFADP